jgi:hypothetical protein
MKQIEEEREKWQSVSAEKDTQIAELQAKLGGSAQGEEKK